MGRPGTDRLKFNKPLGVLPALQYLLPEQLEIDAKYQRSLGSEQSQQLVRGIAQHWNWDLCQPLVVARRPDGKLYVIDGQHRLAAARLRGDIPQLPAVVVQYDSVEDEAASFVLLNQQRKPLTKLDLFKAAVASGDTTASAIVLAMNEDGISIAPHSNYTAWKPGMVSNIGGIEACWRGRGAVLTRQALLALAQGFEGQVLRYAGTIFPGIAAVIDVEAREGLTDGPAKDIDPTIWDMIIEMLGSKTQDEWRRAIMQQRAIDPNLKFASASARTLLDCWAKVLDETFGEESAQDPTPAVIGVPEAAVVAPNIVFGSDALEALNSGEDVVIVGLDGGGNDDDEDPDDLDAEMAKQWEDAPTPGNLAETFSADPAALTAVERRSFAPTPKTAPAPSAPKTPPKIDWGKLGAAAKGQLPASVAKAKGKTFKADAEGKDWCKQCDQRVTRGKVNGCKDRFCDFGGRA